jgi:hypothetical protein
MLLARESNEVFEFIDHGILGYRRQ